VDPDLAKQACDELTRLYEAEYAPRRAPLAVVALPAPPASPVFAPAYLNVPNVTAKPRDEAAFAQENRAPRLDEIEGGRWETDRWRE